jgi:outer membrane cobalamin receptor
MMSAFVSAQTDTTTLQIDEVQVVDSRKHHTLTSTAPLHVMDHGEMLRMGVTDMADALHRLPGITLRDYGGAGGMKTVSVRGFGAKHTGVSYDGVMLSECQSGEIDLSRYSLDNVGSLSLVIGDNDDIFIPARQATTPASVNIQTMSLPTDDVHPHLAAQLKFGSFGYVSPFLKYEQNLSDRFAFSALGEYTYAENDYPYTIKNGIETIEDRRKNSRMNSGHGELNFLWTISPSDRLTGKVYYYDNDRQLPGQVFYYSNTSRETLRDRNLFGQLMYQKRLSERLSLKLNGKFNWSASLYDDGMVASQILDANYWQREYYTSACLLYLPSDEWAFDYSVDYAHNNLNSTLDTDVRPYRNTLLQSATAKYRTRRLTVMGRLLYSLYLNGAKQGASAEDMRRLSPSLSLSYLLLPNLHVRASYKEIFRAPTFNENYFFHYGSKDLHPERTEQLNVGVTWTGDFGRTSLQTTLDGYYNIVKDMIVAVPFNMFVWNCVNVGKVRVLGLDFTLNASHQLTKRQTLTLSGYYSYQRAQNRADETSPYYNNQIAYTPEHSGSAALAWENPWVNISTHLTTVSERWTTNAHIEGTRVKGYYELGASAYRRFHVGRSMMELRLDLKNLTDKQYEIVGSYPMPGRSYQISLNYKL